MQSFGVEEWSLVLAVAAFVVSEILPYSGCESNGLVDLLHRYARGRLGAAVPVAAGTAPPVAVVV